MDLDDLPPEPELTDCCVRCGRNLNARVRGVTAVDVAGVEYEARICQRCVARRAAKLWKAS